MIIYEWLYVYKNWDIKKDYWMWMKNVWWTAFTWYKMISLNWKQVTAHSIIMKAFVWERPIDKNGYPYDINHKNWIKTDNRLENLEYVSRKENIKHSFKNKLQVVPRWKDNHMYWKLNHWSSKPVKQYTMDWKFIQEFPSVAEAGRILWMKNPSNICSVISWRRPHSFGFLWKYNL